jgi:sec-independent protein translocase protein TatA
VKLLNPWELLILVFVLVLIFGPKRLPQMGRSMGASIRGFKDAVTNRVDEQDAEAEKEQAQPAALPPAQATPQVPLASQAAPPEPVAAQPQPDPRERDTVV